MSLLLGCLCFDDHSANELADVLSRSGVRVNKREIHTLDTSNTTNTTNTTNTSGTSNTADISDTVDALGCKGIAPFEIVVLNPVDQIDSAPSDSIAKRAIIGWNWFARHDAKRCLLLYPSSSHSTQIDQVGQVAKALLALIIYRELELVVYCPASVSDTTEFNGKDPAHQIDPANTDELLPTRGVGNKLANSLNVQLDSQVGLIDRSIVQKGPLAIVQSMEHLVSEKTHHVMLDAHDSNDFMNVIRATEQLPLLVGSSAIGLHLPALFRIRGWLGTNDQIVPVSKNT